MNSLPFIYINIERQRLRRSRLQIFYVLDTPSRLQLQPTVHIVGYSGNEYCVDVTVDSITCNCYDKHPACKHILFILATTEMLNDVDMGSTAIHIPTFIQNLSTPSFNSLNKYELDGHTNKLCVATHSNICTTCKGAISHDFSICVRCFCVCHTECVSVYSPDCPNCLLPRHYVHVTKSKSGYRDFTQLITHFNWPLGNRCHSCTDRNTKTTRLHTHLPPDPIFHPPARTRLHVHPPDPRFHPQARRRLHMPPPPDQLIDPLAVLVPDTTSSNLDIEFQCGALSNSRFI